MSDRVVIPTPMQLFLDDVGWMYGRDERCFDKPSRSGMPRKHVIDDYKVLNELGRSLNMKISVALVLGEWDRNNLLRFVPNSNWLGEKWDSSEYLDIEKAEEIRDYLNNAQYIDFGLHGLLHDYWGDNGERLGNQEYLIPETKNAYATRLASEEHIRTHFDTFFEIYNDWGFNKKILSFASPGGCGSVWRDDSLTKILKDYGIKFWCNNSISECLVHDGIIKNPKITEIVSWDSYDVDPKFLPVYPIEKIGIMGGHWLNLLRLNPENNFERLDEWKDFFERNSKRFGVVASRDIEFAQCQLLYRAYGKVIMENGAYTIDLREADKLMPSDLNAPVYISVRGIAAKCDGGVMSVYESHEDYITYKIENRESIIKITI